MLLPEHSKASPMKKASGVDPTEVGGISSRGMESISGGQYHMNVANNSFTTTGLSEMSRETAGPDRFRTFDARLATLAERVFAKQRLSFEDGVALYESKDILAVGWLANWVRERLHGDKTYFNVNRHINPTNVCVAACRLCAFGRRKGAEGAYTMELEEAWAAAAQGYSEAVTEFHLVGGLHPDLPLEYFTELISGLKLRFPKVHIKAFTMVEISFLAKRAKLTPAATIERLKAAGVDSMPGGGAEIFSDRVRHIICDHKIDGGDWIETARLVHQAGLRSNATMLYGHVENNEDRVDHMMRLRTLQDETGGFQTFIPLAFHPDNTALDHLPQGARLVPDAVSVFAEAELVVKVKEGKWVNGKTNGSA